MVKIIRLEEADDGKYKWIAYFDDGTKTRFGAKGMDDYTITKDKEQRERYRARHKKDLETKDPKRAGYMSYYILWGDSTSIKENVKEYNKRFG
jgi:hypothetical protein